MTADQAAKRPPRRPLARRFFAQDTAVVARELIGCTLWAETTESIVAGRIVETEAYLGQGEDPASHAYRGPGQRNRFMFGPPAVVYVYFIYGMHHCFNVVTESSGRGGAVLVRAVEPLVGAAAMAVRRPRCRSTGELCAGPGRLCRALGLDLGWNGMRLGLCGDSEANKTAPGRVWIAAGAAARKIATTPRVGIRQARDWPLRFCDPESTSLSRPLNPGY